jgi:hypothetical protein
VSGPLPPGPVTLAGGASQRFTWNYTAALAGTVEISATVTGFDTGEGVPVSGTVTGMEDVNGAAALLSTWNLLSTTVNQGSTFTERLTVSNTGGVDAWNVTPPAAVVVSPAGIAVQVGAPSPSSRLILAPGTSVNFTYTFHATATGYIDFSATASGQDSGTLQALASTGASSTVAVVARAVLSSALVLAPGGTLKPGSAFTASFTVTNAGAADANLPVPGLALSDGTLARIDLAPLSGTVIAAGTSVTYVWNLTALAGGTLSLVGSLSATDAPSGKKVSTTATATQAVLPRPDGEIAVYPNPASADLVHVFIRLDADATAVTVDVYDASMRRVYAGTWGAVSSLDGTLDITGVKAWAPGIYLVRAVATMPDKSSRAYPVAKLKVQR